MANKQTASLVEIREYKVVKHNDLIQKARFNLSLQEQKIILYLISKIKTEDMELKEQSFEIVDFCRICGLYENSGANYKYIKQTLKKIRDKSLWIETSEDVETLLSWLDTVVISKKSGKITLKINDMMKPYLLHLKEKFTRFELLYTLAMKSQYSIRLYELLKSYEYRHTFTIDIETLKRRLSAENYTLFGDFKRRVLDTAVKEINALSDTYVLYEMEKEGRKYKAVSFQVKVKNDTRERLETWKNIESLLGPGKEIKK